MLYILNKGQVQLEQEKWIEPAYVRQIRLGIFLDQNFFWTQSCLETKIFYTQKFFEPKSF